MVGTAGYDCDEYPFQTTNQGCASAVGCDLRYSSYTDNRAAGGVLGGQYRLQQVVNGDRFYVRILP